MLGRVKSSRSGIGSNGGILMCSSRIDAETRVYQGARCLNSILKLENCSLVVRV